MVVGRFNQRFSCPWRGGMLYTRLQGLPDICHHCLFWICRLKELHRNRVWFQISSAFSSFNKNHRIGFILPGKSENTGNIRKPCNHGVFFHEKYMVFPPINESWCQASGLTALSELLEVAKLQRCQDQALAWCQKAKVSALAQARWRWSVVEVEKKIDICQNRIYSDFFQNHLMSNII